MARRWWKTSEIRQVRELAAEGSSAAQIGRYLDRGRGAVGALCARQGITLQGEAGAPLGNQNRRTAPLKPTDGAVAAEERLIDRLTNVRRETTRERRCLSCARGFESQHAGNRLCERCRYCY